LRRCERTVGLKRVALSSTIYTFDIDLADTDRGVYESLALRMPRHPSESEEYFVTRLLAYCREYAEGIGFSSGVSDPEDPTIAVRDLTGAITVWIEIGSPDAARLHKASKTGARVVVYTHKDPHQLLKQWAGERIHRIDALEVYSLDRAFIAALVARLERRMAFTVSIADGAILVAEGEDTFEGALTRHDPG
jgi:uncharacterized protein YaeQ